MDQNHVIKGDYYYNNNSSSSRNRVNQQQQQSNCDKEEMEEEEEELRRGPWTVEEDFTLINYIAHHGEGRWNSLARCAGLKRTGKSCRLRWLNYLRPDVRRGNITLEEQLMILELHSRWGNRWSKIAQHLPGRTDNEIKNYWRTRVQKHAKQLKCDVNSKQFKDTMRYLWMPRLVERIQAAAAAASASSNSNNGSDDANFSNTSTVTAATSTYNYNYNNMDIPTVGSSCHHHQFMMMQQLPPLSQENSSTAAAASSTTTTTTDSFGTPISDLTDCYNYSNTNNPGIVPAAGVHHVSQPNNNNNYQEYSTAATNNNFYPPPAGAGGNGETTLTSPTGNYYFNYQQQSDFQEYMIMEQQNNNKREYWEEENDDVSDCLWNVEDVWFLQQQLANNI